MTKCRVIITTSCNFKCKYCCNKMPEIQSQFKMSTMDQLVEMGYDSFSITGGEPMLAADKLERLVNELKHRNKRVYLYTNGYESLINSVAYGKHFDGINIGCHHDIPMALNAAMDYRDVNNNVRFHVEKGKFCEYSRSLLKSSDIQIKEWVMNECETDEDFYII